MDHRRGADRLRHPAGAGRPVRRPSARPGRPDVPARHRVRFRPGARPGPGRLPSGATTTLGRALGYKRTAAAEYSFLLAVPAVFASGLFELYKSFDEGTGPYSLGETAIATVIAFVVGYLVIAFLMQYLKRGSFLPFVVYRVVLGLVIIVLLLTGVVPAESTIIAG